MLSILNGQDLRLCHGGGDVRAVLPVLRRVVPRESELHVSFPGACPGRCWRTVRHNYQQRDYAVPSSRECLDREMRALDAIRAEFGELTCSTSAEPGSAPIKIARAVRDRDDGVDRVNIVTDQPICAVTALLNVCCDAGVVVECVTLDGRHSVQFTTGSVFMPPRNMLMRDLARHVMRGDWEGLPAMFADDARQGSSDDNGGGDCSPLSAVSWVLRNELVPAQRDFVLRRHGNDVSSFVKNAFFQGDAHAYKRCIRAYARALLTTISCVARAQSLPIWLAEYDFDCAPAAADVLVELCNNCEETDDVDDDDAMSADQFLAMVGKPQQLAGVVPTEAISIIPNSVGSNPWTQLPRVPGRRHVLAQAKKN